METRGSLIKTKQDIAYSKSTLGARILIHPSEFNYFEFIYLNYSFRCQFWIMSVGVYKCVMKNH